MDSPLSTVVVNLFIEDFEKKGFLSATLQPFMWFRYVDDTFVIWPHEEEYLHTFLTYLNNIYEGIKFTMEKEDNGQLSFLLFLSAR